jgi:ferredoxin
MKKRVDHEETSAHRGNRMKHIQPFFALIAVAVLVLGLSSFANSIWGAKSESFTLPDRIATSPEMTLLSFQQANDLPDKVMAKLFGRDHAKSSAKTLGEVVPDVDKVSTDALAALAIQKEHATKNWVKIPVKFVLWLVFLGGTLNMMVRRKVTAANRKWLYLFSLTVFGVVMGADPSPMGTVKDTMVLFAETGAIFIPRMLALAVFLLLVIVANKFICAWGCQLGTLQDFIFRLGRNTHDDGPGGVRQFRIPFAISNTIRGLSFTVFTVLAFVWALDIIGLIDPFKVFNPAALNVPGAVFIGALLLSALFVYRPWCHLVCPFGLVGWLAEKVSFYRVRVDYGKCVGCRKCESACPSDVMGAILHRDRKAIPDCFSCGNCIEICPTKAVSFSCGKRDLPPPRAMRPADSRYGGRAHGK